MPQKPRIDTTERRHKIFAYLSQGRACTYRIGLNCSLTTKQVYPVLKRMVKDNLLVQTGHGLWDVNKSITGHTKFKLFRS